MAARGGTKTPKLPLEPDERALLRRSRLRLADFADLPAEEIVRATGGALSPDRVRHLRSLALFQQLPCIGPAAAGDLVRLGYETPLDLVGADAEEMFRRLEALTGRRQDPCVKDTLRCAVYYAEHPDAPPDKPWWAWSEERLARRAPTKGATAR